MCFADQQASEVRDCPPGHAHTFPNLRLIETGFPASLQESVAHFMPSVRDLIREGSQFSFSRG